ncbi:zinc metallopeptidase [Thermococcus sp. M39]|uniref:M48 family metallopeptidase n=1 Tax=unclassified Thermococcus TaxID=2627626 RepID=UPI00143A5B1F|nr:MULTISPECIES: M48 family metalloprotease [unclassified Thermococcus]NJE07847.1 zinc metallopeptidase [Thermococcus sp. M39]NJE13442.1 zinc metallopeptidase [Thermococcus sp. LS2]
MLKLIILAQLLITLFYLGKLGLVVILGTIAFLFLTYIWITRHSLTRDYSKLQWEEMPWLYDGIARMAKKAGIGMPYVYILDDYIPNAYSFGNSIVLSLGLFEVLDEDQILGVAAHEIGHIKNGDTILFPLMAYGRYLMLFLSAVIIVFVHTTIAVLASLGLYVLYEIERVKFLKEREFKADETALYLLDRPFSLKEALEELKYYEDLRINVRASALPGIEPNIERKQKKSFMATHPSYDERIWKIIAEIEGRAFRDTLK